MNRLYKGSWPYPLGPAALLLALMLGSFTSAQTVQTYVISKGDTLSSIARAYQTSVSELMRLNDLQGSTLYAGQTLRVPGEQVGILEHKVVSGDTLSLLAAAYGVSERTLRRANPWLNDILGDVQLDENDIVLVPPGEGEVVTLAAGEHVLDVALRYGLSVSDLVQINALTDPRNVTAGQVLFVPASAAVPAAAPVLSGDAREAHLARQQQLLKGAGALLAAFEPAAANFRWPLRGRISSGYGRRNISVGGNTFHGGVDLVAASGTAVGASRAGVVSRVGWAGAYGYVVYVDHSGGAQTRYGHLSQILTTVGAVLEQGDTLGLVGSTGASTGPHLHFELRFDGRTVDPLAYLQ